MGSATAIFVTASRTMDVMRRRIRRWLRGEHRRTALARAHVQAGRYVAASAAAREARAALESGDVAAAQSAIRIGLHADPQHAALAELSAWCDLLDGRADR